MQRLFWMPFGPVQRTPSPMASRCDRRRENVIIEQIEVRKRSITMAETARSFPVVREAVASFTDRAHFRRAVSSLLAAGFRHEDLSVLASHQPLAAAEGEPGEFVAAGLSDELKYIAPLTVAGIVLISGGPIAVRSEEHTFELQS